MYSDPKYNSYFQKYDCEDWEGEGVWILWRQYWRLSTKKRDYGGREVNYCPRLCDVIYGGRTVRLIFDFCRKKIIILQELCYRCCCVRKSCSRPTILFSTGDLSICSTRGSCTRTSNNSEWCTIHRKSNFSHSHTRTHNLKIFVLFSDFNKVMLLGLCTQPGRAHYTDWDRNI